MLESSGALERLGPDAVFRSLRAAVEALRSEREGKAYVHFQSPAEDLRLFVHS